MANEQNLMPIELVNARRTREERRESASKAGKASGEAKRQRKAMQETMKMILNLDLPECETKDLYRNMGASFGLDMSDTTDEEAVDKVVDAVRELSINLGIPQTLREIGVPEEMIPTLAKQAINDACTPGNPRSVTVEDIIDIYTAAF